MVREVSILQYLDTRFVFRRWKKSKTKRQQNYAFDLDPNPLYGDSKSNTTSSVFILSRAPAEADQRESESDFVTVEGIQENREEIESTYNRLGFAESDFQSQLYSTLRFSTESGPGFPATSRAGDDYDHTERL